MKNSLCLYYSTVNEHLVKRSTFCFCRENKRELRNRFVPEGEFRGALSVPEVDFRDNPLCPCQRRSSLFVKVS
jgi:hypothetical protein